MRTFLVLICSLALAYAAGSAPEENESQKPAPKKKQTQASQHTVTAGGGPQEEVNPRQVLMQSQHDPMGSGAQKTKPKLYNSTPSPRGYVGRNDGQVQQSTATGKATTVGKPTGAGKPRWESMLKDLEGQDKFQRGAGKLTGAGKPAGGVAGAQKTKKLKGSATNAAGSSPAVQLNKFSNTTFKPTAGKATTGKPTDSGRRAHTNTGTDFILDLGGTEGQGKPAGAKKAGEKVSPTPRPR
jgi:hypothetical protein